nr:Chain A, Tandem repeat of amyloid-related segment of alphaB-crystallin residues 90-100 mutant V91L [Homo sapiens]3SGR_B Chain B, Tandem repeat of amyloid-related segment of alphaB-crystallin residues 90-100 mutant V91L [Homo sapiens]3SGR_C Chain C, Tandem repeat of amyloid-related segment of alphaB-crystallin residues 90-100 mutant V91L [Homo sapiens]3SGR_D Chain D, Tandem repeat of amyloid-related segment of alphaB-crystallin residues 90-100 mutant V91L [Homo sapiens]3SGR_E Chain E, Tandem 
GKLKVLGDVIEVGGKLKVLGDVIEV